MSYDSYREEIWLKRKADEAEMDLRNLFDKLKNDSTPSYYSSRNFNWMNVNVIEAVLVVAILVSGAKLIGLI